MTENKYLLTLVAAQTVNEIIEALAHFEWYELHQSDCPINRIPSIEDFITHARCSVELLRMAHVIWLEHKNRSTHPYSGSMREWLDPPVKVETDSRQDRCTLPLIVASENQLERESGMLFSGLHNRRRYDAPELPLWSKVASRKRVPLLDLVDKYGTPVKPNTRGVPLVARLFVMVLTSVRVPDRQNSSVRISLTLRELIAGLFPNDWQRNRDWPRLKKALIHAHNYSIHDGRGRFFPLALRYLLDDPKLDDEIVFDVAFPLGTKAGPTIDLLEMNRLSAKSAIRWRAYIATHSILWQLGVTRIPVPQSRGDFKWSDDPAKYPVLTPDDMRRLAFGELDKKNRTYEEAEDAFRDLPGLVVLSQRALDPTTGEVGWRIVPIDSPVARPGNEED